MAGKTNQAIKNLIEQSMQSQTQMNKAFEAMGIDPKVARTVAPLDDNENPETPKNVKATSFLKAVQVSWDMPPDTDAVTTYEIEVTPTAGASYIVNGNGMGLVHTFHNLPYNLHSFRVRFTDKFKRKSNWSVTKSATPSQTAEYNIDLTKAKILGTLQGQLPNENLARIEDAAKLGTGVVLAESMAVQNAAAMRLWVGTGAIERAFLKDAIIDSTKIGNAAILTVHIGNAEVTSAKIQSLSVAKLEAGDIEGKTFRLIGTGKFDAVRPDGLIYTRLSIDGLQLRDLGGFFEDPRTNVGSKITPIRADSYAAIGFTMTTGRRGIYIPAVGDADRNGTIAIEAFQSYGAVGTTNSARLFLDGRSGSPNIAELRGTTVRLDGSSVISVGDFTAQGATVHQGSTTLVGNLTLADSALWVPQRSIDVTIAANSMYQYSHGLAGVPYRANFWVLYGNGFWSPVTNGVYSWRTFVSSTEIEIYNDSNTAKRVRLYLDRM